MRFMTDPIININNNYLIHYISPNLEIESLSVKSIGDFISSAFYRLVYRCTNGAWVTNDTILQSLKERIKHISPSDPSINKLKEAVAKIDRAFSYDNSKQIKHTIEQVKAVIEALSAKKSNTHVAFEIPKPAETTQLVETIPLPETIQAIEISKPAETGESPLPAPPPEPVQILQAIETPEPVKTTESAENLQAIETPLTNPPPPPAENIPPTTVPQFIESVPPTEASQQPNAITQPDFETFESIESTQVAKRPVWPDHFPVFNDVHSNTLVEFDVSIPDDPEIFPREIFLNSASHPTPPPILTASPWVPKPLIEFLMRNKRDVGIATKWLGGKQSKNGKQEMDCITNMEGAMHTLLIPLVKATFSHDFLYMGPTSPPATYLQGKGRQVVLSAAIQLDMELSDPKDAVIFRICQLENNPILGEPLAENFSILPTKDKQNAKKRSVYDEMLRKHMIFHLTANGALPSKEQVSPLTTVAAVREIEEIIAGKGDARNLQGKAILVKGRILSLEVLYNLYKNQLENELLALENLCPQGYVYTVNPPNIFLGAIGKSKNGKFLNRLQALAMKEMADKGVLKNMKKIGFAHFSDPEGLVQYQKAMARANVDVMKLHALMNDQTGPFIFQTNPPKYLLNEKWALVLHNNSDAFGQNIETEDLTSQDGFAGVYSDTSKGLLRNREDLCQHIWQRN